MNLDDTEHLLGLHSEELERLTRQMNVAIHTIALLADRSGLSREELTAQVKQLIQADGNPPAPLR